MGSKLKKVKKGYRQCGYLPQPPTSPWAWEELYDGYRNHSITWYHDSLHTRRVTGAHTARRRVDRAIESHSRYMSLFTHRVKRLLRASQLI